MVLLKNNGVLPLKPGIRKIAVIGPTAELVQSLQGNYNGPPPNPVYPLAGIEKRFPHAQISYAMGSSLDEGYAMPIEHTALHPSGASHEFGLKGEYFASGDLTGTPVLTRLDRNINFNWDKVIPVKGLQRNNYSVRWTGVFTPPAPGDYFLGVRINYCYACENAEGFRLYLDDKLIVQSQSKSGERGQVFDSHVRLDDAKPHAIRLEYLHKTGTAGSTSPGGFRPRLCAKRHSYRHRTTMSSSPASACLQNSKARRCRSSSRVSPAAIVPILFCPPFRRVCSAPLSHLAGR